MNNFDFYEEDEILIDHEDIVDDPIDLRKAQKDFLALTQDELFSLSWVRLCRVPACDPLAAATALEC